MAKTVDITPAEKREDLVINYGELKIGPLPGEVPSELLEIIDAVPQPKVRAGKQLEEYNSAVGQVTAAYLWRTLIPEGQRKKLSLRDVNAILPVWTEHVGLGKD